MTAKSEFRESITLHPDLFGGETPMALEPVATCIGCGCDDLRACKDMLGYPCSWLVVDREAGKGVCSECRPHLAVWEAGS